jgi:hypothetical protein
MKSTSRTEIHLSPAADVSGEPSLIRDGLVASTRQDARPTDATTAQPAARHSPFARLLAALRGDKYMVDAYPQSESAPKEA